MTLRRQALTMLGRGYYPAARVAELLGLSVPRIYQLLRDRRLRAQRIGRSWYVALDSLREYLSNVKPEHRPVEVLAEVERLLSLRVDAEASHP